MGALHTNPIELKSTEVTRKPGIEGKPDQFFLVDAYTFKETLIER